MLTTVLVGLCLQLVLVTGQTGQTNVTFFPDRVEDFFENEEIVVQFNLTSLDAIASLSVTASPQDEIIASVVANGTQRISDLKEVDGQYVGHVTIRGKRLGRTDVAFYIHETNTVPTEDNLIEFSQLAVIVLRNRRVVDDVFRYGIICLAAILYIGFGCKINLTTVWQILRRPVSPAIGLACQFVIMPVLGFGLGQIFNLESALGFGLLTLACSPGGGSSNVWVNLFDGNLDLSLTMTTVSTFASLGLMPFWLYMFGHFYLSPRFISIPYGDVFRSLLTIVLPCAVGLIIKRFAPKVAEKIAWFTRPFSGIFVLYILTFGTYVNLYMYEIMGDDPKVIPAAILLPLLGYSFGLLLALITCRDKSTAATISIETGVQNASIPILVLQGSFPQPEGDVAAVMPVAASLFYTIPIIIAWLVFLLYRRFNPPVEQDERLPSDPTTKSYDFNADQSQGDTERGTMAEPVAINGVKSEVKEQKAELSLENESGDETKAGLDKKIESVEEKGQSADKDMLENNLKEDNHLGYNNKGFDLDK